MSKPDHLAKAKDYIAKGEDYYRKAAEEIVAAMDERPELTLEAIGREMGRSGQWVSRLVNARVEFLKTGSFAVDQQSGSNKRSEVVRKAAEQRPEELAEAIAAAPPEAQRKIADRLVKSTTGDRSLSDAISPPPRKPKTAKAPWLKLEEATFELWEASELLMDEAPKDQERIRMISAAEKAQRLAAGIVHLLNTGELEDEFRDLIAEVGAEA